MLIILQIFRPCHVSKSFMLVAIKLKIVMHKTISSDQMTFLDGGWFNQFMARLDGGVQTGELEGDGDSILSGSIAAFMNDVEGSNREDWLISVFGWARGSSWGDKRERNY